MKEGAMNLIDPIIGEFTHETASTRRMLERVPEEHFDWKPHDKSMTMAQLASHIASVPEWLVPILEQDELVINVDEYVPQVAATKDELMEMFEINAAKATKAMHDYPDDKLMAAWRLKVGDEVKLVQPRIVVIRGMILNHAVHHRGQLCVYLRLKDVPLPAIYGPSADEAE
jgi:uncharacterized damage-inducible protein DinB